MNPQTLPKAASLRAPRKFFEKLFFASLTPLKRGKMIIELPEGGTKILGGEPGPDAHIKIFNSDFYRRCVLYGDVGFGEAYVDGLWSTDDIFKVISWFLSNVENTPTLSGNSRKWMLANLMSVTNKLAHRLRDNSLTGSRKNISEHYDLSNDFFKLFLDSTMTYSCAYFSDPAYDLEAAQTEKYHRLLKKLKVKPTDHILEIGTGWGTCSIQAAKNFGCKVTSITISRAQFNYATARVKEEGLENQITILFQDYRKMTGLFDKIISIEMVEAIGHAHFESYFAKCNELLKPDGLLGLQAILCPDSRYDSFRKNVDWIQKHIFPGSLIPSFARLNHAIRKTSDFYLYEFDDMGLFYVKTLQTWFDRFNARHAEVKALGFDERFIRKWNYYFQYSKAGFGMKNLSVAQIIFTRPNNLTLMRGEK